MNETMTNQNAEQPAETGQEQAASEAKTFTQEEVNGFVQSRISRMRSQIEKETAAELETKRTELERREMQLKTRETLLSKGMPVELAEILNVTDDKSMEAAIELLSRHIKNENNKNPTGFIKIGANPPEAPTGKIEDPYRKVMGLK